MADKVNLSSKVPSYSCRCDANPKKGCFIRFGHFSEKKLVLKVSKISNQININTSPPSSSQKRAHMCIHTTCPKDMKPGNLYVAGETKKTITLTYAPASALCGVAKLFTANAIRWCVCMQNVRGCPIVWGHLVHERASVCASSNLV